MPLFRVFTKKHPNIFLRCFLIGSKGQIVRAPRIELEPLPWQGNVLPLNHARNGINIHHTTENSKSFCAPGGIRTPNDGSEDRNDIHFTTGAVRLSYVNWRKNQKNIVK